MPRRKSVKTMCRHYADAARMLRRLAAAICVGARARAHLALAALRSTLAGCRSTPKCRRRRRRDSRREQAAAAPVEAVAAGSRAAVRSGRGAHECGDLAAAEQGFRALAAAYPTYSGPLLNLGILQAKAGSLRGSREDAARRARAQWQQRRGVQSARHRVSQARALQGSRRELSARGADRSATTRSPI